MRKVFVVAFLVLVMGSIFGVNLITDKGEGIALNLAIDCQNKSVEVESNLSNGNAYLMYANLIIDRREENLSSFNLSFYGKLPYITKPFTLRIEDDVGNYRIVEFDVRACNESAVITLLSEIQKAEKIPVEEPEANATEAGKNTTAKEKPKQERERPKIHEREEQGKGEEGGALQLCLGSLLALLAGLGVKL